jgi:predicted RNase H-like nuclease
MSHNPQSLICVQQAYSRLGLLSLPSNNNADELKQTRETCRASATYVGFALQFPEQQACLSGAKPFDNNVHRVQSNSTRTPLNRAQVLDMTTESSAIYGRVMTLAVVDTTESCLAGESRA